MPARTGATLSRGHRDAVAGRDPGPDAADDAKTLIEATARRLRRDIVRGLHRPGSKLLIEQLRAAYGVGSSTLREALSLLIADALVTSEGQRGFSVAPVSLADFREITDLRKYLETLALRDAIARGDAAWEAGIVVAFHRLAQVDEAMVAQSEAALDTWHERNDAFHEALIAACPLQWARHFRRILHHSAYRYRQVYGGRFALRAGVAAEHRAIMDAALAREADLACALTESHIERSFARIAAQPYWRQTAPARDGGGGDDAE